MKFLLGSKIMEFCIFTSNVQRAAPATFLLANEADGFLMAN
jgi:hypothetical protein